jgi:hypothetical protein
MCCWVFGNEAKARAHEAEEAMFARGLEGREQEFLDSLHVMEVGMRHFFAKARHAKANEGKPETIDANMLQAVSIGKKCAVPARAIEYSEARRRPERPPSHP